MIAVVWSGATTASDIFLLVAVIVAAVAAVLSKASVPAALLAAAVGLVALGLLAV